jgi:CRP/FNR family transcriptional regulator
MRHPVELSLLSDVPIFKLLDDSERATLAALFEQRSYAVGETIFHQGEPGDEIFLVSNGRVQVFITSDTGERIILGENTRGDVFGEISLLDGGRTTAAEVEVEEIC